MGIFRAGESREGKGNLKILDFRNAYIYWGNRQKPGR
jgi:hypothetical protein